MDDFPTVFPEDAADLLLSQLQGSQPFDLASAEQAAWDLIGYGLGQLAATKSRPHPGQAHLPASTVASALDPARRAKSIDWATLVPALVQLLISQFFPQSYPTPTP